MTLTEQIFTQALLLSRDVEEENQELLKVLCRAAEVSLRQKLRSGMTPEDCKADFVAAASMYALAGMSEVGALEDMEQISVGDLTVRKSGKDAAVCCLRYQAELLMMPYIQDKFVFVGV